MCKENISKDLFLAMKMYPSHSTWVWESAKRNPYLDKGDSPKDPYLGKGNNPKDPFLGKGESY